MTLVLERPPQVMAEDPTVRATSVSPSPSVGGDPMPPSSPGSDWGPIGFPPDTSACRPTSQSRSSPPTTPTRT